MDFVKSSLAPNPRDTANIFSILFFYWTIPIFKRGYRKVLEIEDVFRPLHVDNSKSLGERLQLAWEKQLLGAGNGKRRPSLLKAIANAFWREYFALGVLCLINDVILRIVQPQLLRQFLLYFKYVECQNVIRFVDCVDLEL